MGTTALEGKAASSNGKGLVDLWVFKRSMRGYLIDELMPARDIPLDMKTQIREVCGSFSSFRDKMGYKNSTQLPDLSWKAGWPRSADLMLALIEDFGHV